MKNIELKKEDAVFVITMINSAEKNTLNAEMTAPDSCIDGKGFLNKKKMIEI